MQVARFSILSDREVGVDLKGLEYNPALIDDELIIPVDSPVIIIGYCDNVVRKRFGRFVMYVDDGLVGTRVLYRFGVCVLGSLVPIIWFSKLR